MRERVKLLIEGGCTELNPNKAEFPSNCSIQVSLVQMASIASQRLHPHLPTPAARWPWTHANDPQLFWLPGSLSLPAWPPNLLSPAERQKLGDRGVFKKKVMPLGKQNLG